MKRLASALMLLAIPSPLPAMSFNTPAGTCSADVPPGWSAKETETGFSASHGNRKIDVYFRLRGDKSLADVARTAVEDRGESIESESTYGDARAASGGDISAVVMPCPGALMVVTGDGVALSDLVRIAGAIKLTK